MTDCTLFGVKRTRIDCCGSSVTCRFRFLEGHSLREFATANLCLKSGTL